MASTGTWSSLASYRPLIRWSPPGPEVARHTTSRQDDLSSPQSLRRSTRSSEPIFFMARTPSFGGRVGKGPKRTSSSAHSRSIDGQTDAPGRGGAVGGGSGGHPGGRRRHPGRARRRDPRAADPGDAVHPASAGTGRRDPPAAQGEGRGFWTPRVLPVLSFPAAFRHHLLVVP